MSFFGSRKHMAAFALIFLALFVIGTWKLSASPATWFDEGINIGIAQSLVQHGVYNLPVGPEQYVTMKQFLITTNYPVLLPVALSLKLFGTGLAAARVPMVAYLFLFVLAAYLLVRRIAGEAAALWTAALIVMFVPFYGNGKDVLGEVPGLFFLLSALLVLPDEWDVVRLLGAGLLLGLSIATKPFFLLVIPAIAVGEWYRARWSLRMPDLWKRLGMLALGALVPLLGWLYTILPEPSVAGVVAMVHYYSNSYASTDIGGLIGANILRFVTETTPIHFFLLALATLAAAIVRLRRSARLREAEVVAYVFIGLNVLWYLKTPGWYRYFFPAHLLIFLFAPAALLALFRKRTAVIILTVLLVIQAGYLFTKRNDPLYNSDETNVFSSYVLAHTDPAKTIFVANAPSVAFLLSSRDPYQYLQINPTLAFGSGIIVANGKGVYDYIIVDRPVENVLIPDLAQVLAADYTATETVGHLTLYAKNS